MDLQNNVIKVWDSLTEASKTLNISLGTIGNCARGLNSYKTAGGYKWRYADDR